MSQIGIKPLYDRVIVQPEESDSKTATGIIIPDAAKEKPSQGTVLAIGAGLPDRPMTVVEGDKVLYGKYAGADIEVEGKKYLIIRESDIFAIV